MLTKLLNFSFISVLYLIIFISKCYSNDILGCGGFVKSHASLDFSKIEIGLYTKEGSLKEKTECAPTNGYYFLPLYEKGDYILKVHPPPGWSFEPSEVELNIDGETDECSTGLDINFSFNGFGITGRVITAGQKQGPSGINVQLINANGDLRKTVTSVGGDFHFTPVIPGKYIVRASHTKWKLEPSQTAVQVKEGNTALPVGSLSVKGYDVVGSITSFSSPISGIYVLLYSKEEKPKFRVEGCKTALLQGVPDAPICYSITDSLGEFNFGLVPAGEYKLLALSKSPGQGLISYNIKPNGVPFSVLHDSLYIKNAFEVNGFTVIGSVHSKPNGEGIPGVRVLLNGEPITNSDSSGKFTLAELKPATYVLNFEHEKCQFDELPLHILPTGLPDAVRAAAARWRVCGTLTPPEARRVSLRDQHGHGGDVIAGNDGKWCTFLASGTYTAKVEVSEKEQREGLQFFPSAQSVVVSAAVAGVSFSQVRARVSGRAVCGAHAARCEGARVSLRVLAPDGQYVGAPRFTVIKGGEYAFEEVVPGSVEVSIGGVGEVGAPGSPGNEGKLCWAQSAHNVAVATPHHDAPPFFLQGLAMVISSTHEMEVEYSPIEGEVVGSISPLVSVTVPPGRSRHCVPVAPAYRLVPRGCHRVQPPEVIISMGDEEGVPSVDFVATAHSAYIIIYSPDSASDVVLQIIKDGRQENVPLKAKKQDDEYVYEHTLFLGESEAVTLSPQSSALLFSPRGPQRVVGGGRCERALVLRGSRALILKGKIVPPVDGVVVTVEGGDTKLTQFTLQDGLYSFGPLDASVTYSITAHKDSYVFGPRQPNGEIAAHKLAEIVVSLIDDAYEQPLEGALVSVSGGAFRRNAATAQDGRLRFNALSPAQYYVKPNMKEFRFNPPHVIVTVDEGREYSEVFRGVRVAWSARGRAISLGGAGAARVFLRARPLPSSPPSPAACPQQDAATDASGHFRIRGLLPNCVYQIELKESSEPELAGIELAKAPPLIEMREQDVENVRLIVIQSSQVTDTNVLVRSPNIEHYRSLRLTLSLESNPHSPIYNTKLDPSGYTQANNPGLMYTLPRLPVDNKTYVIQVECTLSKVTHAYEEHVFYFASDGKFRNFDVDFIAKVKSAEQELRQSSLVALPLAGALAALYWQRDRLRAFAPQFSRDFRRRT